MFFGRNVLNQQKTAEIVRIARPPLASPGGRGILLLLVLGSLGGSYSSVLFSGGLCLQEVVEANVSHFFNRQY